MRRRRLVPVLVLLPLVLVLALPTAVAAQPRVMTARLSGTEEVPAVDTGARGTAVFRLAPDGESIRYRLLVANIEDVLMAHIHLAPRGENGGVVTWLYPDGPPPQPVPGRTSGVLATGTITADDLVGALAGMDLESLVDAMTSGRTYVNVHTAAHPGGEVRGQIG